MDVFLAVGALLAGIAIGAAALWVHMRAKIALALERGRAETETERATHVERLEGQARTMSQLQAELRASGQAAQAAQAEISDLKAKAAGLTTLIMKERAEHEEKLALLKNAKEELSDAFKAISAEALKSNNQSFLELAKTQLQTFQEAAKGELEKRQTAIGELVKPVGEALGKVDTKIQELEKAREGAYHALREQVAAMSTTQKELSQEAAKLVRALRSPVARGRWGEIQLRRVVELAGMVPHCDFFEQQCVETDDGRLRPDMVVSLPGGKNVVVDSKAPLDAYLDAVETSDEDIRQTRLRDHAHQIRGHMSDLAKKSYFEQFDHAPEFVVLFVPGEAIFSAALEQDPSLIDFGVTKNVIVATPTTLIALLRAVAYGWRQERLAESAAEISRLGGELYKRLADMGGHLAKLGRNLASAASSYNSAVGSLESRVLSSARKLKDLGAASAQQQIDELSPIEVSVRALQALELIEASDDV